MKSKLFILLLAITTITMFQNCGKPLPQQGTQSSLSTVQFVSQQPSTGTYQVNLNQEVRIETTFNGPENMQYVWYRDGSAIDLANPNYSIVGNVLVIRSFHPTLAGNYIVKANGSAQSQNIRLESTQDLLAPVNIIQQPQSHDFDIDQAQRFNLTAQVQSLNADSLEYQWFKNGQPIPNQTSTQLSNLARSVENVGKYFLRIRNRKTGQTINTDLAVIKMKKTFKAENFCVDHLLHLRADNIALTNSANTHFKILLAGSSRSNRIGHNCPQEYKNYTLLQDYLVPSTLQDIKFSVEAKMPSASGCYSNMTANIPSSPVSSITSASAKRLFTGSCPRKRAQRATVNFTLRFDP